MIHHFLLTRFNITLWQHDKKGNVIDRSKWLEERLQLFETYCLPSVAGQNCKDFVWFLLLDESTPETYRDRILSYKDICPNIRLVSVKSGYGFRFVEVFQGVVSEYLEKFRGDVDELCLTTYLDNDDCLHREYVQDVQNFVRQNSLNHIEDYFLAYDYGLQYYTDLKVVTRISYPNNHFMTLVERVGDIKTCYGYGSHFMLESENVAQVKHIKTLDKPMWIEVIHGNNVDNDVKMTFDTKIIRKGEDYLQSDFSIDVPVETNQTSAFFLRCIKQIYRRAHDKFVPRKW